VNYCQIVSNIDDLVYEYFYYEKNMITNWVKHKKYCLLKKSITNYLNIKLKIEELKSTNIFNTDHNFNGFIELYFINYEKYNCLYKTMLSKYNVDEKILNRFTIKFYDSWWNEILNCNNKNVIDYEIQTPKKCICFDDGEKNYSCYCTYIRHPYF